MTTPAAPNPGTTEALRARLAEALAEYGGFPLTMLATLGHQDVIADYYAQADALLPVVVAYGDQREEQGLRDAADPMCRDASPVRRADGQALLARADEIHGRQQ